MTSVFKRDEQLRHLPAGDARSWLPKHREEADSCASVMQKSWAVTLTHLLHPLDHQEEPGASITGWQIHWTSTSWQTRCPEMVLDLLQPPFSLVSRFTVVFNSSLFGCLQMSSTEGWHKGREAQLGQISPNGLKSPVEDLAQSWHPNV